MVLNNITSCNIDLLNGIQLKPNEVKEISVDNSELEFQIKNLEKRGLIRIIN